MTEKQLQEISVQLSKLLNKTEKCEKQKDYQTDWQNVALALDILFFYIFSLAFSTVFLSCVLKLYKIRDFTAISEIFHLHSVTGSVLKVPQLYSPVACLPLSNTFFKIFKKS